MLNRLKTFLPLLLIPLCFFVGLYAGPKATELYAKVFPPKEYTTGDHDALYAKAGHNVVMYTTSTCPFSTCCSSATGMATIRPGMGALSWNSPPPSAPPPVAVRSRRSRSSITWTGYCCPCRSTCQPSSLG